MSRKIKCEGCGQVGEFSRNQARKGTAGRCKSCVEEKQLARQQKQKNKEEEEEEEEQLDLLKCCACGKTEDTREFSRNQLSKGQARRCRSCVDTGNKSVKCSACGQTKRVNEFTRNQLSKGESRRCRGCVASKQPTPQKKKKQQQYKQSTRPKCSCCGYAEDEYDTATSDEAFETHLRTMFLGQGGGRSAHMSLNEDDSSLEQQDLPYDGLDLRAEDSLFCLKALRFAIKRRLSRSPPGVTKLSLRTAIKLFEKYAEKKIWCHRTQAYQALIVGHEDDFLWIGRLLACTSVCIREMVADILYFDGQSKMWRSLFHLELRADIPKRSVDFMHWLIENLRLTRRERASLFCEIAAVWECMPEPLLMNWEHPLLRSISMICFSGLGSQLFSDPLWHAEIIFHLWSALTPERAAILEPNERYAREDMLDSKGRVPFDEWLQEFPLDSLAFLSWARVKTVELQEAHFLARSVRSTLQELLKLREDDASLISWIPDTAWGIVCDNLFWRAPTFSAAERAVLRKALLLSVQHVAAELEEDMEVEGYLDDILGTQDAPNIVLDGRGLERAWCYVHPNPTRALCDITAHQFSHGNTIVAATGFDRCYHRRCICSNGDPRDYFPWDFSYFYFFVDIHEGLREDVPPAEQTDPEQLRIDEICDELSLSVDDDLDPVYYDSEEYGYAGIYDEFGGAPMDLLQMMMAHANPFEDEFDYSSDYSDSSEYSL